MEIRAQERTMKMKVEGRLDPKGREPWLPDRVQRLIEEARWGSEEGES